MPKLSNAVLEQIRAHALREYPRECCGVLLGRAANAGWSVDEAVECDNASQGARRHFCIAPEELVLVQAHARRQELEIAGFYHSHPDAPASWSAADLDEAHWPGCCWLILPVSQGRVGPARAFVLRESPNGGKQFDEEPVVAEEGEDAHQDKG